jgi:kynureninase
MSNAPVLSMAAHRAALDLFDKTSMSALRAKSKELTAYLEFIFQELKSKGVPVDQLTSHNSDERGCQLSIRLEGRTKDFVGVLAKEGVVVDWREPDIIRMAPVPMYNSFEDIYAFGNVMKRIYNVN